MFTKFGKNGLVEKSSSNYPQATCSGQNCEIKTRMYCKCASGAKSVTEIIEPTALLYFEYSS
jgi:hypothetical protein